MQQFNSDLNYKVTVGIPCYNQDSFLSNTINSILSQTYKNIEIIISDDASSDNTESVIEPFLTNKNIFYYKNSENIGRVANYRKIIYEYAKGQWYINVDGDDELIDKNFITDAVSQIKNNENVVMVCAGCVRVLNEVEDYAIVSSYQNEIEIVNGSLFFKNFASKKSWISHLSTLYNVDKAKSINFYNADITSSDYESLFRLSLLGNIVVFKKIVGQWNIHGSNESVINKANGKKIIKNFTYIENAADFALNHLPKKEVNKWRRKMIADDVKNYLSFLLLFKPNGWKNATSLLFKKYPLVFISLVPWLFYKAIKKIVK